MRLPQILPAFQLSTLVRVDSSKTMKALTWNTEGFDAPCWSFPTSFHSWDRTADVEIGEDRGPNGEWACIVDSKSSSRHDGCERESEANLGKHGCSLESLSTIGPSLYPRKTEYENFRILRGGREILHSRVGGWKPVYCRSFDLRAVPDLGIISKPRDCEAMLRSSCMTLLSSDIRRARSGTNPNLQT